MPSHYTRVIGAGFAAVVAISAAIPTPTDEAANAIPSLVTFGAGVRTPQASIERPSSVALGMSTRAPQVVPERPLFISTGADTRAPIGWIEFCMESPRECESTPASARESTLTQKSWRELLRINKWVNDHIQPLTDFEHWGVVERWSYPDDGYGDCEDYVLLKRRLLMQAGWPQEVLLITVVRDTRGDGHAVLTVKTDRGEFILDNQEDQVMLWSDSKYRFVKRQSQTDPNRWVWLGDQRPAFATSASR